MRLTPYPPRLLFIGMCCVSTHVLAQATEEVNEVIVTASRQGEASAQDVPMAISALRPDQLSAMGQDGLADLARAASSVNYQATAPGINRIDMRGVTTSSIEFSNVQDRPLVAIYLDDVPMALQSGNPDLRVFDLERIEVIRGPQGTLFGAGSMAGTIRYITAKPSTKAFSATLDGDISSTDHGGENYSVRALTNVPLNDTLAVRLSGYKGEQGGYIDNTGLGKDDVNNAESTQFRGAARWQPTSAFTLDTSVTYAKLDVGGMNSGWATGPRYEYSSRVPEGFEDDLKIFNVTGTYDFGRVSLIASTSYVDRFLAERIDFGYLAPLFGLPSFNARGYISNDIEDFSEEIRLVSNDSGRVRWTAGVFFQRTKRDFYEDIPTDNFDATFGDLIGDPDFDSQRDWLAFQPDSIFSGTQNIDERQLALFGEGTVGFGKFEVTLGLRYFDFKQDFTLFFAGLGGSIAPGVPLTNDGVTDADGFNPRVVVSYRPTDNVMTYVQAARGFRYGGVNQPIPQSICGDSLAADGYTEAPRSFGPDHLWSYEIGAKSELLNHRATLNIAAFAIDWQDAQTNHNLSCAYYFTQNQGKVWSQGVDLEANLKVTSALTVQVNGSYTDSTANGPIPNASASDGNRTPYFPRYQMALTGDYSIPVGAAELAFYGGVQVRDETATEFNPANPLYREIPGSTTVNAGVIYALRSWEVGLFGSNLTNSRQITLVQPAVAGDVSDRLYYGTPRTVGVRVRAKW